MNGTPLAETADRGVVRLADLGVVAEIGGELSHASILLREARRPAVVNCAGIWRAVAEGDRLRLDGGRAVVELVK